MSSIWARISQRFSRAPRALPPPPLESPVADLPYDEAVAATASMIEEWQRKHPSFPDLEVSCLPRPCPSEPPVLTARAARASAAQDQALVLRLHRRRPDTHAHPPHVDQHSRRHPHEPVHAACAPVRDPVAIAARCLAGAVRGGHTRGAGGGRGAAEGHGERGLPGPGLWPVSEVALLPHCGEADC